MPLSLCKTITVMENWVQGCTVQHGISQLHVTMYIKSKDNLKYSFSVTLVTFQVFNTHMWLATTTLDSKNINHFYLSLSKSSLRPHLSSIRLCMFKFLFQEWVLDLAVKVLVTMSMLECLALSSDSSS